MNKFIRPWYEHAKLVCLIITFAIVALAVLVLLEVLLGGRSIGSTGRLLYMVGCLVLFGLYAKRRGLSENLPEDQSGENQQAGESATSDDADSEQLDRVRESIRKRKRSSDSEDS